MRALWSKRTAGTKPEHQMQKGVCLLQSDRGPLPSQMLCLQMLHAAPPLAVPGYRGKRNRLLILAVPCKSFNRFVGRCARHELRAVASSDPPETGCAMLP